MNIHSGTARPLEPHEEALLETVQEAARGVLGADAATLEVRWIHVKEDFPSWPWFELRPRREGALLIAVAHGGAWIDTALYLDEESISFELWAETEEEQLRLTAERIEAVISEQQVELRADPCGRCSGSDAVGWPGRSSRYSRPRAGLLRHPDLLSSGPVGATSSTHPPADEAAGRIGPRLFRPYL